MLTRIILAVVGTLAFAAPLVAQANDGPAPPDPGTKDNGLSMCQEKYLTEWYESGKALGWEAVGRNKVDDGLEGGGELTDAQACEIADQLYAMRQPAPEPVAAPSEASTATSSYTGAGGDLASIRACESGGDYATNTGNGYSGAYQFDDATWQAAGGSTASAYQASPEEQDAVAAAWIAAGNRGAWPNC